MAHLTLVLGGARSGKSAHALSLAPAPHLFIATGEALDAEMAERITRHKAERGGDWKLVEEPLDIGSAIRTHAAPGQTIVVDCLTLWLSNLMHHQRDIPEATDALIREAREAPGAIVFVSNEIGLGLSPMESLSRRFRDEQGRLNQNIAAICERAVFVAAGLPLVLKGDV